MITLCQKLKPTTPARFKATGCSMFVSSYVLEGHDTVNTPTKWGMEASG